MTEFLETDQGRRLAYDLTAGEGPTVLFLGGLKSDKEGTKALHLEAWAKMRGQAFLRFDYSGHGQSSGSFEEGCIGDWHQDTLAAVDALTEGAILPVGSSMGGWQALLLARARPERIAGLVTIAAAPDFTEDSYWAGFTDAQKAELDAQGFVELPSDYMEPYRITRRMIEDGRALSPLLDLLEDDVASVRKQAIWAISMVLDDADPETIDADELANKLGAAVRERSR